MLYSHNDIFYAGYVAGPLGMSLCLSFVIICMGYLGDYSPPFGGVVRGGAISYFLYRVPAIIL